MCVSVLPACMYPWCPWQSEWVVFPGTGVMGGGEPPHGCSILNLGLLQK